MTKTQKQIIIKGDWNLILGYTFKKLGLLILLTLIGVAIWGLIL